MSIQEEFRLRQIAILTTKGPIKSLAWCREDFAVHDLMGQGASEIIHLASGTAFPIRFTTTETAMRAAKDIQKLRSDWPTFEPRKQITKELRRALRGIVDRHHGALFYGTRELSRATAPYYNAAMKTGTLN